MNSLKCSLSRGSGWLDDGSQEQSKWSQSESSCWRFTMNSLLNDPKNFLGGSTGSLRPSATSYIEFNNHMYTY